MKLKSSALVGYLGFMWFTTNSINDIINYIKDSLIHYFSIELLLLTVKRLLEPLQAVLG